VIRDWLTRAVVFFLAFDGILHVVEVISAYREEAWVTFGLTLFHTIIFFLAAYFVGHDHTHHRRSPEDAPEHR